MIESQPLVVPCRRLGAFLSLYHCMVTPQTVSLQRTRASRNPISESLADLTRLLCPLMISRLWSPSLKVKLRCTNLSAEASKKITKVKTWMKSKSGARIALIQSTEPCSRFRGDSSMMTSEVNRCVIAMSPDYFTWKSALKKLKKMCKK